MESLLGLLLLFLMATVPALAAWALLRASRSWLRYATVVTLFCLFATPSLAAATIVTFPIPFALVLLWAALGERAVLYQSLITWPVWHAVSFTATLLVAAFFFRGLRPNYSLKRTADVGLR